MLVMKRETLRDFRRPRNLPSAWCTRVAPRTYKVVPHNPRKSKRRVTFSQLGPNYLADCQDWDTGEPCASNKWGGECYHVQIALHKHLQNARKERERMRMQESQTTERR